MFIFFWLQSIDGCSEPYTITINLRDVLMWANFYHLTSPDCSWDCHSIFPRIPVMVDSLWLMVLIHWQQDVCNAPVIGHRVHGQPGQVSALLRGRTAEQRSRLEKRHGEQTTPLKGVLVLGGGVSTLGSLQRLLVYSYSVRGKSVFSVTYSNSNIEKIN